MSTVAAVRCAAPPQWLVWPVGGGASFAADLPAESAPLAAAVRAFDDEVAASQSRALLAGLWHPHEHLPPVASVQVLLTSPDASRMTQDELLALAWEPPEGVEVLDLAADTAEITAGPAVVQVVHAVRRQPSEGGRLRRLLTPRSRTVDTQVVWYVQPPGSDQVVICRFETPHPHLLDDLGAQTNALTHSLVVDLEST